MAELEELVAEGGEEKDRQVFRLRQLAEQEASACRLLGSCVETVLLRGSRCDNVSDRASACVDASVSMGRGGGRYYL